MLTYPVLPWYARALNHIDGQLRARRIEFLRFAPDRMLAAAVRQTGLDDFASEPVFEAGLDALCRSAETDAQLTLVGRRVVRAFVLRALVGRLRRVEAKKRESTASPAPLVPPVIVVGLPRSGTTLMHRLLALDDGARPLRFWELMEPIAGPGPDRRRETLKRMLDGMKQARTGLDAKHHFDADTPEECMLLLDSTLVSLSYWVFAPVFSYLEWLRRQNQRAPYRVYRWFLERFQQESPGRRLTLKAPAHTAALGALFDAIPGAHVVQLHRDPAEVIPSLNSLIFSLHTMVGRVDVARMAEANTAHCEHLIDSCEAARAEAPGKVLDVRYDDLVRDPVASVARVHEHFGLPFHAPFAERLRSFAAQPKDKHGAHRYSAEDFSTSKAAIRERFAGYCQRYLGDSRAAGR